MRNGEQLSVSMEFFFGVIRTTSGIMELESVDDCTSLEQTKNYGMNYMSRELYFNKAVIKKYVQAGTLI